jgi:hypothetical protein
MEIPTWMGYVVGPERAQKLVDAGKSGLGRRRLIGARTAARGDESLGHLHSKLPSLAA